MVWFFNFLVIYLLFVLFAVNFFLSFSFFFAMNFFVFFLYLFYKFYILCVKTRVKWVPIPCLHCKNICCKQKDIYYFWALNSSMDQTKRDPLFIYLLIGKRGPFKLKGKTFCWSFGYHFLIFFILITYKKKNKVQEFVQHKNKDSPLKYSECSILYSTVCYDFFE